MTFYPFNSSSSPSLCFTPSDLLYSLFSPTEANVTDYCIQKYLPLCVCRYEVRLEACTALGCSSSDWSSVLTLESPPAGQTAPLLDLQPDTDTGLQTTFLLTWSPPAQPNGRVLHFEVYRRLDSATDTSRSDAATLVYRNISTTCKDEALRPYTVYQYQVQSSAHFLCGFV